MSGWCSLMAFSSSKAFCSIPSCINLPPPTSMNKEQEKTPAQEHRGYADKIRVAWLLDAHHFLDLLSQGVLLFFLFSPTTILVLMPMAGFLLHQPTLGDPARLFLKLAVLLGVAHRRSPPSF